ncbi:50S ribosomal protein L24 [candidate division TA06 bacterium DG_26]|uniref:Large ribosomal subunit protein uL24 n=1 Tax=candidate division TA06 bacterium DG_26 TaxID=1703771 RepID=A0A0S7WJQ1_UNCT6|nr:MAG: 50S ribosomal protein L24 [candidate division TA06 bacterium DG_26]
MRIKKGDSVLVISGDEKGGKGKVLKIFPKSGQVIVEGVNFVKKHFRGRKTGEQSRIVTKEAPVHISSVALVCPKCGQSTRVAKMKLQDGRRARVCKKCGEMIEG